METELSHTSREESFLWFRFMIFRAEVSKSKKNVGKCKQLLFTGARNEKGNLQIEQLLDIP